MADTKQQQKCLRADCWFGEGLWCLEVYTLLHELRELSHLLRPIRLHWSVLPDCGRSVELAGIPIGICTVVAPTALPDHLLILLVFSDDNGPRCSSSNVYECYNPSCNIYEPKKKMEICLYILCLLFPIISVYKSEHYKPT